MTDKEKIREDVSKLIIPESECNGMSLMEKGRQYAYREVLGIIDSTSEEPVSDDTITIRKEWFEQCKKSWYNEGYLDGKHNRDGQFGEPVSEECIYNRTLEERQRSCKFCSAACQVRIKEEPVSEDLK